MADNSIDGNAMRQFVERVAEAIEEHFDGAFPGTDAMVSASLTEASIDVQLGAVRFELHVTGPFRETVRDLGDDPTGDWRQPR